MKKLLIAGGLLLLVTVVFAQVYKSPSVYRNSEPTPTELRRVSGTTDWIQDGPRYNFTEYIPGQDQQFLLDTTNNVVMFSSLSQLTNVVVLFPNPTNSARRGYRLIANGNVTMKLSNTFGTSWKTPTNTVIIGTNGFTCATNRSVWVFNNNRTNWFIDLDQP